MESTKIEEEGDSKSNCNRDSNSNSTTSDMRKYNKLIRDIQNDLVFRENVEMTKIAEKEEKYIKFKSWLIENGSIFEENLKYPVCFGKFSVTGALAKKDIKQNESLLYIPKKLIIDSNELKNNKAFKYILKHFSEKSNVLLITVFLIHESLKEDSFWKPYIDMISADNPSFWSEAELMQLDDEFLIDDIKENNDDVLCYNSLTNIGRVIDSTFVNFDLFKTFYSFVLSRNFCVNENQTLLVPFADALNHFHVDVRYECFDSLNFVCKYTTDFDDGIVGGKLKKTENDLFYKTRGSLIENDTDIVIDIMENENQEEEEIAEESIISSSKNKSNPNPDEDDDSNDPLKFDPHDYFIISTGTKQTFYKGNQVFNFYGQYSNDYLLKWYGFCYLDNKYDYTALTVNIPKNEDLDFDYLVNYFFKDYLSDRYLNNAIYNSLSFKLKSTKINLDLLNYVRFFYFYENEELNNFLEYKFSPKVELEILNRTNEILSMSLNKKNEKFKLEEDFERLKLLSECLNGGNTITDMRMVNILIFRITQKMNLVKNIQMVKSIIKILEDALSKSKSEEELKSNIYPSLTFNDKESIEDCPESRKCIKNYFTKLNLIN